MAARVTAKEVRAILDNTELSDPQIGYYITSANTLVNSVLGLGTTDILKEIERWFTAHMIACTRERMAIKEGAGGASITYTGKYEEGLKSTPYGQMVLTLDTTGLMAAQDGKKVASIYAIKS
jgi:hypothetical protein